MGRREKRVREESKPGREKEGRGGGGEGQEKEGANAHMKALESQWSTQTRDSISYKKFLPGNMYKETTGTFPFMKCQLLCQVRYLEMLCYN